MQDIADGQQVKALWYDACNTVFMPKDFVRLYEYLSTE